FFRTSSNNARNSGAFHWPSTICVMGSFSTSDDSTRKVSENGGWVKANPSGVEPNSRQKAPTKKTRGRRPTSVSDQDAKKYFAAWKSGRHTSFASVAAEFHTTVKRVRTAVRRMQKRRSRIK